MPSTVQIVYNHFPKLTAALRTAVHDIVMETCFGIETTAKIRCPVDTGALRASIHTEPLSETSGEVGTNIEYSVYVEYGTSKMGAQPYMTPAAEAERRHFMRKMSDLESRLE
jgi:HK97 gp10 family phage protein